MQYDYKDSMNGQIITAAEFNCIGSQARQSYINKFTKGYMHTRL